MGLSSFKFLWWAPKGMCVIYTSLFRQAAAQVNNRNKRNKKDKKEKKIDSQ